MKRRLPPVELSSCPTDLSSTARTSREGHVVAERQREPHILGHMSLANEMFSATLD